MSSFDKGMTAYTITSSSCHDYTQEYIFLFITSLFVSAYCTPLLEHYKFN